jgi:hypothetical protein
MKSEEHIVILSEARRVLVATECGCSSLNTVYLCLFRRDFCLVVLVCEFGIPAELGIFEVFLSYAQQIKTPDFTSFPIQFHTLPSSISHFSHFSFAFFPIQFHILRNSISHPSQFNFNPSQFNFTSFPVQFHILPNSISHPSEFNFTSFPIKFHILPSSILHPSQFIFTSLPIKFRFLSSSICSLPLIVWV